MQHVSIALAMALTGLVSLAHEGAAQTAAPSTGSRLITLGTLGGPNPRPHRAQSSNLLIVNGTQYIIDAGDGVARRMAKGGFDIGKTGTIFLTHLHDDHTAGLGTLMSVAWDQNRTQPIHVYGPPRTEELVKAAVQYFSVSAELRIADGGRSKPISEVSTGHDVGTGEIYKDANLRVTAVENTHFAFHKGAAAGLHKSYSYRFEMADRSVVFTGDTGASESVIELAKGADVLVTETSSFDDRMQMMVKTGQWQVMTDAEKEGMKQQATRGHMTTELVGQMAARANVKALVLSHLTYSPSGNYDRRAEEV